MLQSIFNENFDTNVDAQENIPKINAKLGFDWSWIPENLQAGQASPLRLQLHQISYAKSCAVFNKILYTVW